MFGQADWLLQTDLNTSCPTLAEKCVYRTRNDTLEDRPVADILLWHMRDLVDPPLQRSPAQKWAFVLRESPAYSQVVRDLYDWDRYNFTVTYRKDADVTWNYGSCRPLAKVTAASSTTRRTTGTHRKNSHPIASGKKHNVAWFTSNCDPQSKRQLYAHELSLNIDVHIYGTCSFATHSCSRDTEADCQRLLNDTYRFALAFENSLCDDYVTEKVLGLLAAGVNVIPVVLGKADYSSVLPPRSYIDVRDYKSPRHLAQYLALLSEDWALYESYFEWRRFYTCGAQTPPIGCELCAYAVRERHRPHRTDAFKHFDFDTNCVNPSQFYGRGWALISSSQFAPPPVTPTAGVDAYYYAYTVFCLALCLVIMHWGLRRYM